MAQGGAPLVYGTARLAGMLYAGASFGDVLDMLGPEPSAPLAQAGWLMDRSWLYALNFSPYQAAQLQAAALALSGCFRVHGPSHPLRLLGLYAPIYQAWPGPILNNPALILPMSRDWLFRALSGLPGVFAAPTWVASRADLQGGITGSYPVLLRPYDSHAGDGLVKADSPADVPRFLSQTEGDAFYVSRFVDYRGEDGWYAKYRIAFVDGAPFLCHMAVSQHWMVHYLNAGMTESVEKRNQEAQAMADFDAGFARRHAAAFGALHQRLGFDFYSIDCAETQDGRLLVFEADAAAIIHMMDPHEMFPYKRPQMRKVFEAFDAMLRRRAGQPAR